MRLARAPCLLRDSLHGGFTCVLLVILNQFLQFSLFLVSHNPRLSPAYPPHSRRIFTALFCEPSELRRVLEKVNYAKISPRAQRHLSLYLPPFSLFSSMFSPRQSAPCATWDIPASKSTRSTRPLKKVLQLPRLSLQAGGGLLLGVVKLRRLSKMAPRRRLRGAIFDNHILRA